MSIAVLILSATLGGCRSQPADSSGSSLVVAVDASTSTYDAASIAPSANSKASAGQDASSLAQRGFICVPPLSGDFERCPKGAMAGDDRLRDCLRRQAETPPKKPTFQIGSAPSSSFSPTHWRCAEVPLDTKTHVTIDTLAGLDETVPSTCAARAIDMIGPNQYGAIFFRCSNRERKTDEILAHE